MKIKKIGVVHDNDLDKNKKLMVEAVFSAINKKYEAIKIPFDEDFFKNIKRIWIFKFSWGRAFTGKN